MNFVKERIKRLRFYAFGGIHPDLEYYFNSKLTLDLSLYALMTLLIVPKFIYAFFFYGFKSYLLQFGVLEVVSYLFARLMIISENRLVEPSRKNKESLKNAEEVERYVKFIFKVRRFAFFMVIILHVYIAIRLFDIDEYAITYLSRNGATIKDEAFEIIRWLLSLIFTVTINVFYAVVASLIYDKLRKKPMKKYTEDQSE